MRFRAWCASCQQWHVRDYPDRRDAQQGDLFDREETAKAPRLRCPGCGGRHASERVKPMRHRDCDARCVFATSRQCSCACGGANHGAGQKSGHLSGPS